MFPHSYITSMRGVLFLIVLAEFFGTSSWFSGNAAMAELSTEWSLSSAGRALLLTSVQLGFIVGTLGISLSGLADRFRASRIFAASAVLAAGANLAFAWMSDGLPGAAAFRFLTGLFLAGIYPLGMKLAVGWMPRQKGEALGWLVGALVLGTASPHLIRAAGQDWPWRNVVTAATVLTLLAAGIVLWLGDGPSPPRPVPLRWGGVLRAFGRTRFRAAALGYFGHMWELYAFWFLVPQLIRSSGQPEVSLGSFIVMAMGALGCVLGGIVARRLGSGVVAATALSVSGTCCFVFPLSEDWPGGLRIGLLLIWGLAVVADSPQFSAISAQSCPPDLVGAALAVQNGLGFAITIAAIQLVSAWPSSETVSWLLAPGPVLGIVGMMPLFRRRADDDPP
ncbi:MAG: MFS transporter [Gemmataceae bacterium]|nr:MFS transporter [Gemmataceae bacterium]